MAQVYEVNVLGDVADLFAEMGSKLLQAAFLDGDTYTTDYNYANTAANVILSQDLAEDITTGEVGDGTIVVPFADHGLSADQQPLSAQLNYGLKNPDSSVNGLYPEMLKPAIKLRTLVDLIIRTNGFTYSSDFFASSLFGSIYMTLSSQTERVTAEPAGQFLANKSATQIVSTYNEWVQVSFDDDSVLGFDNDGNYSTVTNTYITAQGGTHRFQTRFNVFASSMAAGAEFNVIARISKGTVSQGSQTVTLTEGQFGTGDIDFINFQVQFLASTSEAVQVEVYIQDPNGVATPVQIIGNTIGSDPTAVYFSCTAAPGGQVQIPQCLPRIKQKEFMSDLCQRFNLVIESDPDNPQNLYIEPYADWIGDGADTYWTDKLDLDKERTLMPTSSIKAARINFADKESGDIGNAFIKDTQGEVFGAYDQDIDDDFATGDLTNSPVFSPYFVYTVPTLQGDPLTFNETFLIHRSYQRDGAGVKPISQPPKLFFATGVEDIQDTYYIDNTAFSSYLFCSPLSESPLDADTQSLYWNSRSLPFSITNDLMAAASPTSTTPTRGYLRRTYT
jgi:hypothetical protein